jgi:DNA-binding transcriptional LysR family regulator
MAFVSNNPSFQLQMALIGKGVAFIPEFLCADHIQAGRLVHIHKSLRGQEIPISLVMPEQKEVSLKIKKFVEFMSKKLKEIYS